MKKTLLLLLSFAVLLLCFVSCNQDDIGIIRLVVDATPQSTYQCVKYIGQDSSDNWYVLTKENGIIYFPVNSGKAGTVKTFNTNTKGRTDGAYINGNNLYVLNGQGAITQFDVTGNTDPKEYKYESITVFKALSANGYAISSDGYVIDLKTNNKISGISDASKMQEYQDTTYVFTSDKIYYNEKLILSDYPAVNEIYYVFSKESEHYAIVKNNSQYEVHKISENKIKSESEETISGKPTAVFEYDGNIYIKTDSAIDMFGGDRNITTGWAQYIYSGQIPEIKEIDSSVYCFCSSGGILKIDFEGKTATSIFTD